MEHRHLLLLKSARAAALASVVIAALLACKSKSKVTGTLQLDGAAFPVKECQVSEATISTGGSQYTVQSVTFVGESGQRLQFSNSRGLTARIAAGTGAMDTIGEGCGTLTVTGSVKSGAGGVKGALSADCTGAGHHVQASVNYEGCGTYGLNFP